MPLIVIYRSGNKDTSPATKYRKYSDVETPSGMIKGQHQRKFGTSAAPKSKKYTRNLAG